MAIEGLLKSQSNEVFLALVEKGWKAEDFKWESIDSPTLNSAVVPHLPNSITLPRPFEKVKKLIHKASEYYFIFDNDRTSFYSHWSPSDQLWSDSKSNDNWRQQIESFKIWLKYLDREVNAPDLWEELPTESQLIESAADDDNSKFTKEEKELIVNGLEEIKQYLLTAHNADAKLLEGQIKYLVESSDRLGRKDWKNILISTILSIIIQGGIAGHSAQEIFNFVWTVLSAVLIQKVYLPGV